MSTLAARRTSVAIRASGCLVVALLAAGAAAQDTPAPEDARLPVTANRFEIEGGYRFDYVGGRDSDGWYKIQYRGTPLALRGTPSQYSDTIVLDRPKVAPGTSDRTDLNLRFEEGTLALAGGLFDLEGVRPLTLAGLEKLDLRGTAFVASDRRFDQVTVAVGIETPSFHVSALGRRAIANWLVLGVNGQRREITDGTAGDANFVAATYRGFIGKAWFRARPQSDRAIADVTQRVHAAYLKQGPTYEQGQAAAKQLRSSVAVADRAQVTRLYLLALRDEVPAKLKQAEEAKKSPLTPEEIEAVYSETLRQIARGYAITETEERLFALYAELSGWYEFRSSNGGGRQKNLFTVSADYWFMPGRDDVFLRLRYENGFERGVPQERKNQLMLSLALKF